MTSAAYVDTSVLIALAFGEPGAAALARRVNSFDSAFASNLLEAEFRSAHRREEREPDASQLNVFTWVMPARALSQEIVRVLQAGSVRGADCWHLATALYIDPYTESLTFLTLDGRQKAVAKILGFAT